MNPIEKYPVGSFVRADRREPVSKLTLDATYVAPEWAVVEGHGFPTLGPTLRLRDSKGPFTVFVDGVFDFKGKW